MKPANSEDKRFISRCLKAFRSMSKSVNDQSIKMKLNLALLCFIFKFIIRNRSSSCKTILYYFSRICKLKKANTSKSHRFLYILHSEAWCIRSVYCSPTSQSRITTLSSKISAPKLKTCLKRCNQS